MSVVIATALLSPAFFSCQKEASPQGTEPTPVQIYILRAKKTTLQGLDLFFFHDDALALLDSYQHIDAPAQERVQGIAGSGAHHLVAFSNVPASRFQWSDIRSVPALSSVSFSLEDDSPAAPFLFGQCPLEEGRSRRCTLRLTPALCKIELRSLSCDFRGKAYEGLPFHLERIFLTYANEAYQPLSPGTAMSYRNPGYLAEASSFQHPEMLLRPIGQDIIATRTELEESLYCYPNPATGAEMGRMPTHLVLEGTLDGHLCYYPIEIPHLEAAQVYSFDITLRRMGSPDPDIPVSSDAALVETLTVPWQNREPTTVSF